jgi:polar amino acid transport system substrate-binding protein
VNNRIPALTSGRVDILFATMAMLPDRAKAVQFSQPYNANAIVLIGPKDKSIKTNEDMAGLTISVAKGAAQDTQVTKNAPSTATIRRYDGDAASVQALVSGQTDALGGNIFYLDRVEKAVPGKFENKLEFQKLYNGACTRLGEKELNVAVNAFIDKIKANGELKTIYDKWMKVPVPEFPTSLEGIPFTAN